MRNAFPSTGWRWSTSARRCRYDCPPNNLYHHKATPMLIGRIPCEDRCRQLSSMTSRLNLRYFLLPYVVSSGMIYCALSTTLSPPSPLCDIGPSSRVSLLLPWCTSLRPSMHAVFLSCSLCPAYKMEYENTSYNFGISLTNWHGRFDIQYSFTDYQGSKPSPTS